MQKFLCLLLAILLVACAAPTPAPTPTAASDVGAILTVTAPQMKSSATSAPIVVTTPSVPARTLVVAHRGGAALAPENTLAAFANAIRLGVDMVECDVHLSKDGELVVMHDPDVSRTTDGHGQISDLTLAEIKKLNDAAKFPGGYAAQGVPTLAELLDLVKGKVGIQIEIKLTAGNQRYPGIERKVVDLINARNMADQVIVISLDFPTLKDVKAIDPHIKTGALVQGNWTATRPSDQIAKEIIQTTGADYFMPTSGLVNAEMINAVHAGGLKMGVWTVDAPQDMQRYASWGVDAITTNRPDELKRVLGK
jgi:glycerophosphoryl diester phosphodiesterase